SGPPTTSVCLLEPPQTLWSRRSATLSPMPLAAALSALLDRFRASRPVRAWSLIVTLYGDAIVPRGGSLWLGSLTDIMAPVGLRARPRRRGVAAPRHRRVAGPGAHRPKHLLPPLHARAGELSCRDAAHLFRHGAAVRRSVAARRAWSGSR